MRTETGLMHRFLLIYALTVSVICYFYELTNFSISIDEELYAFGGHVGRSAWLGQGRWGMALLVYLFPPDFSVIPFLPTLLFSLLLGWSAWLISLQLNFKDDVSHYAFIGLFVSSPIWVHIAQFNTLSWGAAIGLLCIAYGYILFSRGNKLNFVASVILFAFATAIYQGFIILIAVLVALGLFQKSWPNSEGKLKALSTVVNREVVVLLLALGLYVIVSQAALAIASIKIGYISNFINFAHYTANFARSVSLVVQRIGGLLLGGAPTYLGVGAGSLVLVWAGFVGVLLAWVKAGSIGKRIAWLLIGLFVLVVPFSLMIMAAGYLPLRALVAVPLLLAVVAARGIYWIKNKKIALALLGVSVFSNVYISTSLFYADHIARKRDGVMASQVLERIQLLDTSEYKNKIPVVFVGHWTHQQEGVAKRIEVFGSSFFEHDGGNPHRILSYAKLLGAKNLQAIGVRVLAGREEEVKAQPVWPAPGAVYNAGDVVVVKLGEFSHRQIIDLERVK